MYSMGQTQVASIPLAIQPADMANNGLRFCGVADNMMDLFYCCCYIICRHNNIMIHTKEKESNCVVFGDVRMDRTTTEIRANNKSRFTMSLREQHYWFVTMVDWSILIVTIRFPLTGAKLFPPGERRASQKLIGVASELTHHFQLRSESQYLRGKEMWSQILSWKTAMAFLIMGAAVAAAVTMVKRFRRFQKVRAQTEEQDWTQTRLDEWWAPRRCTGPWFRSC